MPFTNDVPLRLRWAVESADERVSNVPFNFNDTFVESLLPRFCHTARPEIFIIFFRRKL